MKEAKKIVIAVQDIRDAWGEAGEKIIDLSGKYDFNITFSEWLDKECYTCGGNWFAWWTSGLKLKAPDIWDAIPNDWGGSDIAGFKGINATLTLCGIDMN